MEKKQIQDYINNFRRRITKYFKPGIGMSCNVYPAVSGGAILEFIIGTGIKNDDSYYEIMPTVTQALAKIKQHAFGGNLSGFVFSGTNFILEDNKCILIKDDSQDQWNANAADIDVHRILSNHQGASV